MGKDVVQFKCHHCSHCCTEVVCLPTPWDVLRIVRETGADPKEFLTFVTDEDIDDVDDDDATWLEVGKKQYLMALKRDEQGCFFLDKKTRFCSIYESRPMLCRLFPFRLQEDKKGKFKGFTLHKDVGCPRHKDGEVATKPLHELYLADDEHQDEYIDLVTFFNGLYYEDKKPEDFVNLFIQGA
jgi:Fe-S-cluster containining protein